VTLPYGTDHSRPERYGEGVCQHLLYGWSQPAACQVYHGHYSYYN